MDKEQVFSLEESVFSLEELESRFELEALAGAGFDVVPDWTCECNIKIVL